jgi:hypothetical protein
MRFKGHFAFQRSEFCALTASPEYLLRPRRFAYVQGKLLEI